jgi:uncharacterized protein YhhL (DUF1145 family)
MDDQDWKKKVITFLAVSHAIEALIARRMAKKRGKSPNLWFAITLVFGIFAIRRLKKVEPLESEEEKGRKEKKKD